MGRVPYVDHADGSSITLRDGDVVAGGAVEDEGASGTRELRNTLVREVGTRELVEAAHHEFEDSLLLTRDHVAVLHLVLC